MDVKNKTQPEARCGIQLRKSRNPDGKKTGVTGVQFCPKGKWAGTYSAIVRVNGICWAADGFRSIDEAAAAREKAKQEMIAWGSYNSSAYDSPNPLAAALCAALEAAFAFCPAGALAAALEAASS